jgi:predicted ribosomally synthesized peptide with SipW-like signal peptide
MKGENTVKINVNKRKVLVIALAVCLLATLSLGTLAWFTAQDSVTNQFYVGDSNTDPDDVFGIDVWETVDGQEIGRGVAGGNGATYEAILPGQELSKAPVAENTGIHSMFVRAIVTVNNAKGLKETMADDLSDAAKLFKGNDATEWLLDGVTYTEENGVGTLVYTYYYQEVLESGTNNVTPAIFDSVIIPSELTNQTITVLDGFTIDVVAQAIQSEYIGYDNAKGAFTAYWQ